MVKFTRAGDLPALKYKILIFGDSGVGKTHALSTFVKPGGKEKLAFLACEDNGLHTIKRANPDALVFGASNLKDVKEFMLCAINGEFQSHGITALAIDGLTEIQQMMKDQIIAEKGDRASEGMNIRDWGTLKENLRRFMRMLRTVDFHVICSALVDYETEESDGCKTVRKVKPQFQGKTTASDSAQYFNAVGFLFRGPSQERGADGKKIVERVTMFDGPSKYIIKSAAPLVGQQVGDSYHWVELLLETPSDTQSKEGKSSS